MRSSKQNSALITTIAIVGSLVFLNLLSMRSFFRIDLTRDKKFTLSEASKQTVKGLQDVLTVRAYFTEGLPPPYSSHARYVRDILEEYRSASKKISFQFIDPNSEESSADKEKKKEIKRDIFGRMVREPTKIEKELSEKGIEPVEIRVIEDDQQQTKRAYMAMELIFQDKKEVISLVQEVSNLEKDLTGLMIKLTRAKTPIVGIVHTEGVNNLGALRSLIGQNVEVKDVDLATDPKIASEIDALLVVGKAELFKKPALEAIDEFLSRGKSAAFFIDRFNVDLQMLQASGSDAAAPIDELLKAYGVTIGHDIVADVKSTSINMQERRGGFVVSRPVPYPFIPDVQNVSSDSPITRGLVGMMWPFGSSLKLEASKEIVSAVLAKSSRESWLERSPLDISPHRDWGKSQITTTGPYTLAVSLIGKLPRGFGAAEGAKKESRILVAGTSAFLWDQFMNGPQFQANQVLAQNMVDWMVQDPALLAMRARAFVEVPLADNISDVVRNSVKYGNMLGVPLALFLYGLLRWRLRELRRQQITL